MVWRWDKRNDFTLILFNPASDAIIQGHWERGNCLGDILSPELRIDLTEWLKSALGGQGAYRTMFRSINGTSKHWEATAVALNETDVYVTLRDVTDEVLAREHLRAAAFTDGLTGKYNQEYFQHATNHILESVEPVAALFIDLDGFKSINDGYGHSVGDRLLIEISNRVESVLRQNDILARYGGDEFVCLLRSVETHGQVAMIAERVSQAISEPWECEGIVLTISASIGIAMRSPTTNTCEALLEEADRAMYRCKGRCSNLCPFCFAEVEDDHVAGTSAVQTINDFRKALKADDQLILHYQEIRRLDAAILDPRDYPVAGYEALIRWQHPTRGLLFPSAFLSHIEQDGLMAELTQWVIREATQAKKQLPEHVYLAVNISPLLDADEMSAIARTISPSISVEITESALAVDATIAPLWEMRERGVGLLLDDMGTEHSNLTRTLEIPWDGIKIDRSFKHSLILPEIVSIIHKCGSRAIVEGIEPGDEELLKRCVSLGIEYGQGWLWDRGGPLLS